MQIKAIKELDDSHSPYLLKNLKNKDRTLESENSDEIRNQPWTLGSSDA